MRSSQPPDLPFRRPPAIVLLLIGACTTVPQSGAGGASSSSTTQSTSAATSGMGSSTSGSAAVSTSASGTSSGGAGGASVGSSSSDTASSSSSESASSGESSSASTGGAGGAGPTTTNVRMVAGNLTSGGNQTWDSGAGIRILQGVHADILMLQEFNYQSLLNSDFRQFTDLVCGAECTWVRGPAVSSGIPNVVISRYPFISSGSWTDPYVSNRSFVYAEIDVPGPVDLWAISVHLLTSSATARQNEAIELMSNISANALGDLVVVGGDFNTSNRTEPALMTFDPIFDVLGPYPADLGGDEDTNSTRTKPYDWLLVNDSLDALSIPTQIGAHVFPSGAVIDTRVYTPISDLAPAMATDSAEPSMQHMAVVRDFALSSP